MKILKYKKLTKGRYKIFLDNNKSITLYEEIILKYELLFKKEIDDNLLIKLQKENNNYDAYDMAVRYIDIRIRCESEMREFLKKKSINEDLINKIILKLKENNLLNEKEYIKSYAADKFNLNNYGPNKIIKELQKLKLDNDLIYDNVCIDNEELYNKLEKLIDKKIKQFKNYSGDVLKYKIQTYFIELGYDKSMISDVLKNKDLKNPELYQKEYDKLYKKYSKKYSGNELEQIIKQKLYQKGFTK